MTDQAPGFVFSPQLGSRACLGDEPLRWCARRGRFVRRGSLARGLLALAVLLIVWAVARWVL